jgi:hypothetical protein
MKVLKPDLKGKNNEDYPTVRIRFECDRRVVVLSHTLTLSVTNPLVKWTHDCKLVVDQLAFQLAEQLSSVSPRSWEVETLCPCV